MDKVKCSYCGAVGIAEEMTEESNTGVYQCEECWKTVGGEEL